MDEKAADAKGIAPVKPELDRIAAVKDKGALIDEIAHVHLTGPSPLFNFYSAPDLHNADQVIAYIDQGGLTLPDRDYYIKDDPDKVEKRQIWSNTPRSCLLWPGKRRSRRRIRRKLCCGSKPCWRTIRWIAPSAAIRKIAITR